MIDRCADKMSDTDKIIFRNCTSIEIMGMLIMTILL